MDHKIIELSELFRTSEPKNEKKNSVILEKLLFPVFQLRKENLIIQTTKYAKVHIFDITLILSLLVDKITVEGLNEEINGF